MTIFYLVRHAQADWVPDENRPLSAQGRADADRVADVLWRYPIGLICSSPYRRARETIAPLAARLNLPMRIEPDLRERELGVGPADDFVRAVGTTWRDPAFAYPGGETNEAAQRRGLGVLQRLRREHEGEHIVLSTHGNVLALILQCFRPLVDFAFWQSLTMPDIYELRLAAEREPLTRRLWEGI
jgi:2,3-bisphosphoglycerate-dependent phosphoglycerate mutase